MRHIADSVVGVLVPPGLLPVGVVELTAALELVLDEVEVLGHARVVGLAVGFEQVVEDVAYVDVGVVAVEEDERDAGYLEAQQDGEQREEGAEEAAVLAEQAEYADYAYEEHQECRSYLNKKN